MGNWVTGHHQHADEYMGSGWPFTKTVYLQANTLTKIELTNVTKALTLINKSESAVDTGTPPSYDPNGAILTPSGTDVYIAFYEEGLIVSPDGSINALKLSPGQHIINLDVKCKELWLLTADTDCELSIVASLTNIDAKKFPKSVVMKKLYA